MHIRHTLPVGIAVIALLAGCASPVTTNIQPSPANVAKYRDLSDINVVATLEKSLNEARAAEMPLLAPNYYKEAAQVLSECKNQLGNQPRDILAQNAARGDAILEKGRAVMDIVKYRFAQELELKARLDALATAKLLPTEYTAVMGDLSSLIERVEREQPGNIDKDKDALLKAMQDLEVKAVQQGALHEAEAINADSLKSNAEKQAPITFAEAQRVYADAKKQIAASPRDEKLVQRLGEQALFAARHASQVNERVALLMIQLNVSASGPAISVGGVAGGGVAGGAGAAAGVQVGGRSAQAEKMSAEKIVLQEEDRLLAISTALGLKDMRDLPLNKQVEEIKRAAGELARQPKADALQDLEARLKTANDASALAQAQVAARDRQLKDQAAQLAEKDAQISALNDKLAKLEAKKPAPKKPKAAKPQAASPSQPK